MTEGVKYDAGKDRWDIVPWGPLRLIVAVITLGAAKYSPDNWKHVEPARYRAALMRHLSAAFEGEWLDGESGLPHYAHAGACVLFLLWHGLHGGQDGRSG